MRPENLLDLADAVQAAENSLSKAHILCRELCERYFQYAGMQNGQTYTADKTRQDFIVWEYGHYSLYAHILQDYILQTEAGIAGLSLMLRDCQRQYDEAAWSRREYQTPDKKRA